MRDDRFGYRQEPLKRETLLPESLELESLELGKLGVPDNAARAAPVMLAGSCAGRPMKKASPHIRQPHSGQSPSATSGQLAGSGCSCSKGRSSLHPEQYLVSWVIGDLLDAVQRGRTGD